MELFDIIKIMFETPRRWHEVTAYDKKKNYFMINRFMSINYPLQANALQNLQTNQEEVVNYWYRLVSANYNRTPSWIYTKAKKKDKVEPVSVGKKGAKTKAITSKMILTYANAINSEYKSVKEALDLFGDDMAKEIKEYNEILNDI
ncbi:MAG: hypothetical protein ACRDD8_14725 [Bacteroidales bacterium]